MLERFNTILAEQAQSYKALLLDAQKTNKELLDKLLSKEDFTQTQDEALRGDYKPIGGYESQSAKRHRMSLESFERTQKMREGQNV